MCCEFASPCSRLCGETTSQGCMCVICLFDCDVNGVISYHILCLFPQKWRWSQRLVVRLVDFMDKMHAGPQHPEGGQSTLPARLQPLSPQQCCCCTGRHTCYTFPGVWRWRGHKHPAAQRTHTYAHGSHKKGSNSGRPHCTHYRARTLHSVSIVSTTYHNTFRHHKWI